MGYSYPTLPTSFATSYRSPIAEAHMVLETVYDPPKDVDFSNQTTMFPFVTSPSVNGFQYVYDAIEICLHPIGSRSDGFLANNIILLIVFFVVSILSLATLVLMFLTARKNGRGIKLFRRIQRTEGTYFAVENGTWIPLTMFLYCGCLVGQQIDMILTTRFLKTQINLMLWRFLPFTIMFLQGHFFAFSMLIGGIITTGEVWIEKKIPIPKPWQINTVQFLVATVMTVMTVFYTIKWNQWTNYTWTTYVDGKPLWLEAADSWVEGQPMNTTISEPAFKAYSIHMTVLYISLDYAKKVWIVWLCSSCLPLLTLSAAAGLLLKAVRSHINNVLSMQSASMQSHEAKGLNSTTGSSSNFSSTLSGDTKVPPPGVSSSWNLGPQPPKTMEARRSIERMRSLEKTMIVRIACVLAITVVYSILVIAFTTQNRFLRRHAQFLSLAITLPWVSAVYTSLVMQKWFMHAWREWREATVTETTLLGSASEHSQRYSMRSKRKNDDSFFETSYSDTVQVTVEYSTKVDQGSSDELAKIDRKFVR